MTRACTSAPEISLIGCFDGTISCLDKTSATPLVAATLRRLFAGASLLQLFRQFHNSRLLHVVQAGFKKLVNGEMDDLPEAAFYMVGDMDEAVEKAQKLAADAA